MVRRRHEEDEVGVDIFVVAVVHVNTEVAGTRGDGAGKAAELDGLGHEAEDAVVLVDRLDLLAHQEEGVPEKSDPRHVDEEVGDVLDSQIHRQTHQAVRTVVDGVEETVVFAEVERLQEAGRLQERGEGVHVGGQDFRVDAVAERRGLDGVGERGHREVCTWISVP